MDGCILRKLEEIPAMSECPKFGEQMNCPKEEPVDCELFSFCEFITAENEKNRSSGE